jgi:hypothetical protein
MAEEILAVPPCKHNFGHGVIFPLTAGLYLYVGRRSVRGFVIFLEVPFRIYRSFLEYIDD